MKEKVILILVDGMRPDALSACGNPFTEEFLENSAYTLEGRTIMPSVTLPCHMSLFHSVVPQRHGILSNTYVPQVRPIDGLFEQIKKAGGVSGSFYNWEELRDLSRPGSLARCCFVDENTYSGSDGILTEKAAEYLSSCQPDFLFLYLGETDEKGHGYGWMSREYLQAVHNAWHCIETIYRRFKDSYGIFVTADHGGHERMHGSELPEDMLIPVILHSKKQIHLPASVSILDIAPTIAELMGVRASEEWEGTSLL